MEKDARCLVDLVIELTCDRRVEETVEQPAVGAPEVPVRHQGEGPSASHPVISRSLSVWSRGMTTTHTAHSPWATEASGGCR